MHNELILSRQNKLKKIYFASDVRTLFLLNKNLSPLFFVLQIAKKILFFYTPTKVTKTKQNQK